MEVNTSWPTQIRNRFLLKCHLGQIDAENTSCRAWGHFNTKTSMSNVEIVLVRYF